MNTSEKLQALLNRCKASIHIVVNEHRLYYLSAQERLGELSSYECPPEISDEVRAEIVRTDTIIDLQFYPDTPIGSYSIVHHSLDAALDDALECLNIVQEGAAG